MLIKYDDHKLLYNHVPVPDGSGPICVNMRAKCAVTLGVTSTSQA